jgi:hypothetical protein
MLVRDAETKVRKIIQTPLAWNLGYFALKSWGLMVDLKKYQNLRWATWKN